MYFETLLVHLPLVGWLWKSGLGHGRKYHLCWENKVVERNKLVNGALQEFGRVSVLSRGTRQVMTCYGGHLFTPVVKIIICKKLLGFTFIFVTWNGIKNKIWTTCRNKTFGLGFELFPPPFTSLTRGAFFIAYFISSWHYCFALKQIAQTTGNFS